jgi:hypothetical protein
MTPNQEARVLNLGRLAGVEWFSHQWDCYEHAYTMLDRWQRGTWPRLCLYYKTGAGKTITALVTMKLWSQGNVLVIAPPSTHEKWRADADSIGMNIDVMSHAKFRMKNTKVDRATAVIADEFHLFGGHSGKGWKKLDQMARGLQAPMILMSATPNYNDAERVYCVQHILDPVGAHGGYLDFLYRHCITEQNPFSMTPDVTGFQNYRNAEEFLAMLPNVLHLPDTASYTIDDYPIKEKIPPEMAEFGLDPRRKRMIASIIEEKHARVFYSLINDEGFIHTDAFDWVSDWVTTAVSSVLIYCNHSTVAGVLYDTFYEAGISATVVTGKTSASEKQRKLDDFRKGDVEVLIGTATLATGTDGLDKVCDWLIIVDDTEDDALRRQLIGRILPRGAASITPKHIKRLVIQ